MITKKAMIREIEFRAWNIKHGQMRYEAQSDIVDLEEQPYLIEKVGGLRHATFFAIAPHDSNMILMQYTSRKDRNGLKIFEGDIIEDDFANEFGSFTKGRGAVVFCPDCLRFVMDGKHKTANENDHYSIESEGIVIGNIYQNPELL